MDQVTLHSRNTVLARNWWAIAIRGAVAIVFGLSAFILPLATLSSLVVVLAIYLVADGVFAVVAGIRAAAHHERWVWLTLEGLVNLAAGLAAAVLPGLTLVFLIAILGAWSVVSGVLMLVAGFRLDSSHGRWLLVAPIAGALILVWWLGVYALMFGVLMLVLAWRLRTRRPRAYGM